MKTMNTMKMWAALLVAGLALTACSSDDNELIPQTEEPQAPQAQTFTVTVVAQKGGDAATTRGMLTDNGTTVTPEWEVNDEVSVYNVTKGADITGTLKAQTAGTTTTLTGDLKGTIDVNDKLRLSYKSANYATQAGTLADIAANCDYAIATVNVTDVSGSSITTTDATFTSQQAIVKFTLKNSTGSATLSATQLKVVANGSTYTITPTPEASVLYVAIPGFSSKTVTLVATVGGIDHACVKNNVTLADGNYYRITAKLWNRIALSAATTDHLGFVIGADGYVYPTKAGAEAASTTASGIIAYVGSAGSVDESSSTYKGLAIALADANSGSTCQWYEYNSGSCVSVSDITATALGYKNGIACTETLVNSNSLGVGPCAGHTHAAAKAAKKFSTDRPSDVSPWFLPSIGQWNLIVQGLATKKSGSTVSTDLKDYENPIYTYSNLNSVITDAGGTDFPSSSSYYWSSTMYSEASAWCMIFNKGRAGSILKDGNRYVRAVFAF